MELHVVVQDVSMAFDSMRHERILDAHARSRINIGHQACLACELTQVKATIQIAGTGTTAPFDFSCRGKQGGVETPDEWNALLADTIAPVVACWNDRAWGFKLDSCLINHAIWAGFPASGADYVHRAHRGHPRR